MITIDPSQSDDDVPGRRPDNTRLKERGSILCVHTCWGLDHAEWLVLRDSTQLPDGSISHQAVGCDGQVVTLLECAGGDLEPGWSNPCRCWDGDPELHAGHCCFQQQCDHHDLMRACEERLPIGDVPMYETNTEWGGDRIWTHGRVDNL